jgi:phosphate-selective porin OprO/OprP
MMRHLIGRWLAIAGTCAYSTVLTAQASAPPPPAAPAGEERSTVRLASNGDVTLTMGGYLQVDGRLFSGAAASSSDGLILRRARLIFDARMANGVHLRLQPDFGQGRVVVQDAFIGYDRAKATMRIGRFRPAYGVERSQSSATLLHGERSLANSLMPSRSFGAQASVQRGALTMTLGGFHTAINTSSPATDTDGDLEAVDGAGYDGLLRLAWDSRHGQRYRQAQIALLAGNEEGEVDATGLARLLTVGQQPLLSFRADGTADGTAVADGTRRRALIGGLIGNRRVVTSVEGALLTQDVRLGDPGSAPRRMTAAALAWRAAYVLGGTRRPTQEIVPTGPRGAMDLGVRAGSLSAWGDALPSFITRRSVTHALSGGVAVGWVPTALTRLSLAYDITLTQPARAVREHFLLLRVQQSF